MTSRRPSAAQRPWLRILALAILAAVLVPGRLAWNAPPARATNAGAGAYGGLTGPSGIWIGSYQMSDGTVSWCALDPEQYSPLKWAGEWGDWHDLTGDFQSGTGLVLDAGTVSRIAYVLGRWGTSTVPEEVGAVYRLLHQNTGVGFTKGEQLEEETRAFAAAADAMWEEAARFRGPYTLDRPHISLHDSGLRATAVVQPVRSSAGETPPARVRLTIQGPAVWEDTGQPDIEVDNGVHELRLRATGSGAATVTVSAELPADHLRIADAPAKDAQRLMLAGLTQPISAQSTEIPMVDGFQPVAASQATSYAVGQEGGPAIGARLTDRIVASAAAPDPWIGLDGDAGQVPVPVTYRVDWWYSPVPLPTSVERPDAVERFDSTTVVAAGPGVYQVTTEKAADRPGFYYPVASVLRADQVWVGDVSVADLLRGEWTAPFHDEDEEAVVPWEPTVMTQASELVGGRVRDEITVQGARPDAEYEIASTLMATTRTAVVGGSAEAPGDARPLATVTTEHTGNGTVVTPWVPIPWGAFVDEDVWPTLYWVETISADAAQRPWAGRHLLPAESLRLQRPAVETTAGPGGTVPVEVFDTATVSGTIPQGDGVRTELGFQLYRFEGDRPVCADERWAQDSPAVVRSAGQVESGRTTIAESGTYGYVETLTLVESAPGGERRSVLDRGECGAAHETVVASLAAPPPALPATGASRPWTWAGVGVSLVVSGAAAAGARRSFRAGRGRR